MFASVILLAAAPLLDAPGEITAQAAAERVAQCGVGTVSVVFDPELGADELVVATNGPIAQPQLACIEQAAAGYKFELSAPVQIRVRNARLPAQAAADARKWLKAHHLKKRLPKYKKGVTDEADFARRVEALCDAEGALQLPTQAHSLNPEWATAHASEIERQEGPLVCLLNATRARGFDIGFAAEEPAKP